MISVYANIYYIICYIGSLPIVIVNRWEDLSKELLEAEWERIVNIPLDHWDWKRLLLREWMQRIRNSTGIVSSSSNY